MEERGETVEKEEPGRRRMTMIVAVVITVAWTMSFLRDMFDAAYDMPPAVTPLMTIVAGWCFVGGTLSKVRKSTVFEKEELNGRS